MLMTLQNYSLKVIYKPGQEMFISDTLSRATAECTGRGTAYQQHTICLIQEVQEDLQHVNQADYLNVTDQQIRQHTDQDESLQTLRFTVLTGWPDVKEERPLIIRGYWPCRDEISAQMVSCSEGRELLFQIRCARQCLHGRKDYLLIVDHYSDFWEIELLPDLAAETVRTICYSGLWGE